VGLIVGGVFVVWDCRFVCVMSWCWGAPSRVLSLVTKGRLDNFTILNGVKGVRSWR